MDFLIYVGPTIIKPEKGLLLIFGKTYTEVPENVPEILQQYFVPIEDYTKVKKEAIKKHPEILKQLLKEVR
jgi:hypothetical protein